MADIIGVGFIPDEIAYKDCGGSNGTTAKTNRYCGDIYNEHEEKRMIEQNGTDGIFKNRTFDDYKTETPKQRQAKAAAQKYAYYLPDILKGSAEGKRNLFLYGSPGTGKTTLASIIIYELSKKGIPSQTIRLSDMLNDIKDTFKSSNTTEREALVKYKTIKVLAIDDLGQEKTTKWAIEKLFDLIDYRYSHGSATIFTTNYTPEALEDRLIPSDDIYNRTQAKAILSRILGSAIKVPMYWDDYRFKE